MKRFRAPGLIVASVCLAALVAGTATAVTSATPKKWAFSATFAGTATEKVNDNVITATTKGTGKVTLIGKSKIAGTVTATTQPESPCAPFNGPGTISNSKTKLKVVIATGSRGCAASEDDRDNISVSGTVKVSSGTLKYKKAKGTLRFTGHYDRKSGAFTVKLTGKLTY